MASRDQQMLMYQPSELRVLGGSIVLLTEAQVGAVTVPSHCLANTIASILQ